jgi:hypothetical protein
MAQDSMMAGLFGTPEAYQQQQQTLAQEQATNFAKLDPYERVNAMAYMSGRGIGNLVGGLLGVQDPQLRLISARNAVFREINPNDPESLMAGAQKLAQFDPQGATALANQAREAAFKLSQVTKNLRERQGLDPIQQIIRSGKYTPQSIAEYEQTGDITRLALVEKPETERQFGAEREAIAGEMFDNKSFNQLTPEQKAIVNKRVEEEGRKRTPQITNVLPGQKEFVDIPRFRATVQSTIEPQSKTVYAADQALQNITDSLNTNNFASFRAAQVQFARAMSGAGDLSQKELTAAGADPSLLGGTADTISKLFSGTPTLDTQEKMKKTLQAIRIVAAKKANDEISRQAKIAGRQPGYTPEIIAEALDFPEFKMPAAAPSAGGPFTDAEKEKRYQAWKNSQTGQKP